MCLLKFPSDSCRGKEFLHELGSLIVFCLANLKIPCQFSIKCIMCEQKLQDASKLDTRSAFEATCILHLDDLSLINHVLLLSSAFLEKKLLPVEDPLYFETNHNEDGKHNLKDVFG